MKKLLIAGIILFVACLIGVSIAVQAQNPPNVNNPLTTSNPQASLKMVRDAANSSSSEDLTPLQLEIESNMSDNAWLDPYLDAMLNGTIDRLPGFKDYVPPDEPMPKPTPDVRMTPPGH